jgi:hypothetical protein
VFKLRLKHKQTRSLSKASLFVLRYSKNEQCRERQLRHCEYLFKRGQYALASRLIKCIDSAMVAKNLGLVYPDYQCDSRYCEYCGPRKVARYRRTYGPIIEALIHKGHRLSHLVLTTKDTTELERGHSDRLLQAFNKIYRSKPLKGKVVGAFAQYEIKFNGDWHPHLHILLIYIKCPSQDEISQAWYRLTGGHQTDIRKIQYNKSTPQSIHNSVSRLMNYICKYTSFDGRAFERVFEATYNKKLVRTYGLIRKHRIR